MRSQLLRHVFLDIDDTITHCRGEYTSDDFLRDMYGVFGSELAAVSGQSRVQAESYVRHYADEVIWYDYLDFIRKFKLDAKVVWPKFRELYQTHFEAYDDAVNLIRSLSEDSVHKLYIISNNPVTGCLLKLEVAGLSDGRKAPAFEGIFGTNVTCGMKGRGTTWQRALEMIGSDGHDVTTVGDDLQEDGLLPQGCGVARSVIVCRKGMPAVEAIPSGVVLTSDLNELI